MDRVVAFVVNVVITVVVISVSIACGMVLGHWAEKKLEERAAQKAENK